MKHLTFLLALALLATPALAGDGHAAFEKLKALEGTWTGEAPEEYGGGTFQHVFRVSANGTVVMETMKPGSDHEMINMYHLDGDDLVLTHYCAGGNQPTMKMAAAKDNELHFDFTGGTNLDPATDTHIHAARIVLLDDDTIDSIWTGWSGGEAAGDMVFHLERSGD